MTKISPKSKAEVVGYTYPVGLGMSQTKPIVFVGYTTQGKEKALADFKYRAKTTQDSEKLKALRINVDHLEVVHLRNTTMEKVESDVNYFINRYDTFNNGWNSILR